jgi:hypothetical protein
MKQGDTHWRITLLHILQEVGSICKTRNHLHYYRKMIETAGSLIEQRLPKSIHAVTPQGFELKVVLFVVAYSLSCYNDF